MVGGESEHLGKVAEGAFHVVLVVQTQSPHIDGVGVHVVNLEDRVGRLRGLGIPAQEGQTLRPGRLDGDGVVGDLQSLVQTPESLAEVPRGVGLAAVCHHALDDLHVPLLGVVVLVYAGQLGEGLPSGDGVAEHHAAPRYPRPALGELGVEASGGPGVVQGLPGLAQHQETRGPVPVEWDTLRTQI